LTRRFGRKSLRDTMLANKAALDFMADGAGKPRLDITLPPAPKKRVVRERTAADPALEGEVLNAICDLLAAHPRVILAVRQNSGAMPYLNNRGKQVPVWFYRWIKRPDKMRVSDIWGFLDTRGFFQHFAIEVKREGWKEPRDQREFEQAAYLAQIRYLGGCAGFATSVEQAREIIES
jgi:hypothetical protein